MQPATCQKVYLRYSIHCCYWIELKLICSSHHNIPFTWRFTSINSDFRLWSGIADRSHALVHAAINADYSILYLFDCRALDTDRNEKKILETRIYILLYSPEAAACMKQKWNSNYEKETQKTHSDTLNDILYSIAYQLKIKSSSVL